MEPTLNEHYETIGIICDSFGWQSNRVRQYKRAASINDEMCVFLEEIKNIIMNHKEELAKVLEEKEKAEKTMEFNKIKLEILQMETWHCASIRTMINLFADKWNDEGLRIELLTYLNTKGK